MHTFADKIIAFNSSLELNEKLPDGIRAMNPFREDPTVMELVTAFYIKFYDDTKERRLILGINPGRFGAGVTGVMFTDTKHLQEECGIEYKGKATHEPSSVFVYEVIKEYGGTEKFYGDFYINSVCPLGFVKLDANGRPKNYNYYDSRELTRIVYPFCIDSLKKQIGFGLKTDVCYCFGAGKNFKMLLDINRDFGFFGKIIPLEHPRFIMQYKSKSRHAYIRKYMEAFLER